jgi:hypothetical protein
MDAICIPGEGRACLHAPASAAAPSSLCSLKPASPRGSRRPPAVDLSLAAALLVAIFSASTAAAMAKCAPCLRTVRGALGECRSSAAGAFIDARAGCLRRDPACVEACGSGELDCRDATGIGAALGMCASELQTSKGGCRTRFLTESAKRENCVNEALVTGLSCRNGARKSARPALRSCRRTFESCTKRCGPGTPPLGFRICKARTRATFEGELAGCKGQFDVARAGCLFKNYTCVQACGDADDACTAPVTAAFTAAVGSCVAQRAAAEATCRATHPAGGTSLDQCVNAAQTNAFVCRVAARDAARPGLKACVRQSLGCVRACPSVPTSIG